MNELFRNKFRIETTRLKSWDYSKSWWYYITICTKEHQIWFGEIKNEKMFCNDKGKIVTEEWHKCSNKRSNIELDEYCVMPKHFHGIIILTENDDDIDVARFEGDTALIKGDEARYVSTTTTTAKITDMTKLNYSEISPKPNSLSSVIRSFKSSVTKQIREAVFYYFSWQSRFYDRIIRNEKELYKIRKYIQQNPLKWEIDKVHPDNIIF
jgi:REP element-mobilizing transposase RayT